MKYIFLSKQFYSDYSPEDCPEIAQKHDRPYVMLLIKIDGLTFAIPFRSNIRHKFAFITDEENHCGIDYSKAVVINNKDYIDNKRAPKIRKNEYKALFGNSHIILKDLKEYIREYKRAVKNKADKKVFIYRISTLQYFHKELGLK